MDLVARLILDSDEYDAGLDKAVDDAEKKGGGISRGIANGVGGGLKVAGAMITAASAAMIGLGSDSVQVGMSFDSSMSQVAATMGKTVDEIQELRDFAQEMGSTTAFSATQAADALNYMALAGYDAEKSMAMLPSVLNLAAAGGMDLASASDMVTDAASALSLSEEETAAMIDQMAAAASKSNTSVSQLGSAILTIGATAANVKGGTTELSTVLGVLADNGIKGAEGGTHLRNILLSLQDACEDGAVDFGEFAVQIYDADGNMRSMIDIIDDMQSGMDGMSQASKDALISGVFNKADLASVNALLNTSQDRFRELETAISDSAGAADAMAAVQLDNLQGDVTLLKSAYEGFQIAISDKLTPNFREFVRFGSEGLSRLTEAFKKDGLNGAMEEFGNLLSEGIAKLIDESPKLVSAGAKLLTALVKGFWDNRKKLWNAFKEIIRGVTKTLGEEFPRAKKIFDNLQNVIDGVFGFIEKNGNTIIAIVKGILTGFVAYEAVIGVFNGIQTAITAVSTVTKILNGELAATALVNPYTAIAVSIGAVIGLTTTLMEMEQQEMDAYVASLKTLSEENQKRLDFADEYIGKLDEMYEKNRNAISSVDEELQPQQELLDELNKIVDANGRVKKGYEERAEVILTQLNEAFGTEMILQDGIIQNYDTEMAKIDQLIAKKKAEAIIDANKAEYAQALKDQIELYNNMNAVQDEYNAKEFERAQAIKALERYERQMNDAMERGSGSVNIYGAKMQEMEGIIEDCTMQMDTMKETLDSTKEAFYKNQDFIEDYNYLLEASEGNTEDLTKAVENMTNGIIDLAPDDILKRQADNQIKYLGELLTAQENDVKISERQIEEAINSAEAAIDALRAAGVEGAEAYGESLEDLVDKARNWGVDFVSEFTDGISAQQRNLSNAVDSMANTVRSRLHFSHPDVGPLADFDTYAPDMMDLFAKGILDNENKVSKAVENAFDFEDTIISSSDDIPSVTGASSGLITPTAGRNLTVVFEMDKEQFGKVVYRLNNDEVQRVGVNLGKEVVS